MGLWDISVSLGCQCKARSLIGAIALRGLAGRTPFLSPHESLDMGEI